MLSKSYQNQLKKAMLNQIKDYERETGQSLQSCKNCLDEPKEEKQEEKKEERIETRKEQQREERQVERKEERQEEKKEEKREGKKAKIVKGKEEIKMVMEMVKKGKEDADGKGK